MYRSWDNEISRSPEKSDKNNFDRSPQQRDYDQRSKDRSVYELRERKYHLDPSQTAVLRDVGAFRTISVRSIETHVYANNSDRFKNDVRDLADQGLIRMHVAADRGRDRYVTLTKKGKKLTEVHLRISPQQTIYSGIVKPRELRHDAAIYDVYQKEAKQISQSGGTPKRVVLDFEFKKNVNRQLAKIQKLAPVERERQRREIAEAHQLKIVNGKLQIPDLRVEYESREQEQCKVDLECVTGHYKSRQIAAKTAAGFKLYNQDYRGKSAERGEDLIGEVMSL